MKMHLKKKTIAAVGAVLLLAVTYLVYSRPMTIQKEYPMLSIDKCTGIRGYYRDDTMNELQEFNIERSSEEFDKLWDLLYEREYRRSLKDLLPQGTRIYQTGPGDFQWEVYFSFDTVETPDGNGHSGTVLQFERWYDGALDIEVIGENHSYNTDDQDAWAKEIFDIIRSVPSAAPAIKDGKWDVTQLVQIKAENFPEAPDGVYMTLKSVGDGKVTATMHNDTAEEWDYDKLSYTLQVKLDDVWYTVPRRDNIVWSDVAIRTWMNPGDKVERTYGLGDWGELPSGTYRVAQMVSQGTLVEKNRTRWFLMAEFEIS